MYNWIYPIIYFNAKETKKKKKELLSNFTATIIKNIFQNDFIYLHYLFQNTNGCFQLIETDFYYIFIYFKLLDLQLESK